MAEEGQASAASSAFPAPPPFYGTFTTDNIERLQQYLQATTGIPLTTFKPTDTATGLLPDAATLPADVRKLVPPSPPSDGIYTHFGTVYAVDSAAADTQSPTQGHLMYLTHQILLQFFSITHVLSIDPAKPLWSPAWDLLKALFVEVHQGLNAWRAHQARETLMSMMEEQIEKIRAETDRIRDSIKKAKEVIDEIGKGEQGSSFNGQFTANQANDHGIAETAVERKRKQERLMWRCIEREVGQP